LATRSRKAPADGVDIARVRGEIAGLRESLPSVTGVMVASTDGLAIAHDLPDERVEQLAAMVATTLGMGRQVVSVFTHGDFRETVTVGSEGYLVVYRAGEKGVLAVLAPAGTNVGLVHHFARQTAQRLAQMVG
jgi:uncharacterized protein